jgi:predicted PurR-regulated permease PerM
MMALNPSSQPHNWTFRRVVWATLVLVAVAASFWLLYRFYHVVFIFFVAMLMGTVIRPAVAWLQRRGIPRLAGVLGVYGLLLALLIGFVLLLFPLILEQSVTITAAVPGYYQHLRGWMEAYPNPFVARLSEFLPATLPSLGLVEQTGPEMIASAGQALRYVTVAVKGAFYAIVILLLTLHWTLNGQQTLQSWVLLLPKDRRKSMNDLITAIETTVGAYIAGQGVLCLVIGFLSLVAYLLIGLPNALVLALVAGVLEAVPMVGPLLAAIPAAVVGLSIAPARLVWVIVASVVIQQLENTLLVPRIMRKAVGVNPFVSLLALFAFSSLFGIAGALMAIPTVAILQILFERFVFGPEAAEAEVSPGRDYASRLRYEALDLARGLRKQARLTKRGSILKVQQIDYVMDEIEIIATDLDVLLAQEQRADPA